MTPSEFDAVTEYDDRFRYELIHGVLIVNPIPAEGEADPNEELGHLLRVYRDQHPHGASLDSTLPERYVRTGDSRRRADRVIWAGLGRTPMPRQDPPTIAVEFISRSRRDRRRDYEEKRDEYQHAGLREYWIIDRFERCMTIWRYQESGAVEISIREHEVYETELLPGFALSITQLFALSDRWDGQAPS